MFGVQLDGFDDQVECVHAVDLARHTVGFAGREAQAFGEVEQAIERLVAITAAPTHPQSVKESVLPYRLEK